MGHAIECRINCEDPNNDFLPSCGVVKVLQEPTNEHSKVRIDTGFVEGDEITSYYDPLLSKIIAHGETREQAIEMM
jgi:3-methylcrotonyl-CoA carboxylase alpha subunit